jgi:elongation factor 1 alpha-like protein
MSNRRVKSLAADDDDYGDDFYEEEYDEAEEQEMSPEDKEQMRINIPKVREALGSAYNVSDKAIQDALWNYYYDIAKSTTYLKSKRHLFLLHPTLLTLQDSHKPAAAASSKQSPAKKSKYHLSISKTPSPSVRRLRGSEGYTDQVLMGRKTCRSLRILSNDYL